MDNLNFENDELSRKINITEEALNIFMNISNNELKERFSEIMEQKEEIKRI